MYRRGLGEIACFSLVAVLAGIAGAQTEAGSPAPETARTITESKAMAQMREAAKNRQRRIIYNNDGNEILIRRIESVEDFLGMRIEAAVGTQVDSISYCTGVATMYGHDTQIAERFDSPEDKVKDWADNMRLLRKEGTDQLGATIHRAHQAGMEVFWSHRVNDIHDTIDFAELFSQWKARHPECLMSTAEDAKTYPQSSPRYWWTALDFEKPDVREYLLRITEEVCQRYDVDGIEMDYFRYPMFFRPNLDSKPATQGQLDILTGFQRSIREMGVREGEKRGRPILVVARVPMSVTACRNVGIDIERWLQEGLLDIMPLGNGDAWPNIPARGLVKLGHDHGVPAYPCLKYSGYGKDDIESWRAAAANAWRAGADGIYFFNHFPGEPSPQFKELGDPASLAGLDKRFAATDVAPYEFLLLDPPQHNFGLAEVLPRSMGLPRNIPAGDEPTTVVLQIGDDIPAAAKQKTLAGAVLKIRISPPGSLDASACTLNGETLTSAKKDAEEGWLAFEPNPSRYRVGENEVSVRLAKSEAKTPARVLAVECHVTYCK
jgi:hypothetical protein